MTQSICRAMTAAALLLFAADAKADYLKLYPAEVEAGEVAVEANVNLSSDHRNAQNGYLSQVYTMEYGVNRYWKTELGVEIERDTNGADTQLTNLKWENVLAPWRPGELWMDIAFYGEVEKAAKDNDPDNVEFKLLLEKDIGPFETLVNIGAQHEFGPHHAKEWDATAALRVGYRANPLFEPGIEYYADTGNVDNMPDYGDQTHLAGPVIYGKYHKLKYDTGLLFGTSNAAPDTTVKLNMEYEF